MGCSYIYTDLWPLLKLPQQMWLWQKNVAWFLLLVCTQVQEHTHCGGASLHSLAHTTMPCVADGKYVPLFQTSRFTVVTATSVAGVVVVVVTEHVVTSWIRTSIS